VDNLLNDKGIQGLVATQLGTWEKETGKRCGENEVCKFSADSGWLPANFKGFDAKNAIGHVKYRINASVSVSADGNASTTYRVDLFKNWNFDRGKMAPMPYTGTELDLGQFLDLHEHGWAQEYDMLGTSSLHGF